MTSVLNSTRACADHGDAKMFAILKRYYTVVASEIAAANGRLIKVIGDGTLLTFPPGHPRQAVEALWTTQAKANALWREFDERCQMQVKVGIGTVICGLLGAPGEERFDIIGTPLNSLIKAPSGPFEIMPELAGLLE